MKTHQKVPSEFVANVIDASVSSAAMALLRKVQTHVRELERIESSLVDEVHAVEREGAGREVRQELLGILDEIREAELKLVSMVPKVKGWATDAELGFLT